MHTGSACGISLGTVLVLSCCWWCRWDRDTCRKKL